MKRFRLPGVALALLALGVPASAQTVIGAKSGVINWAEGDTYLADKPYVMQPSQFGEVKENMVFRTEEGRAEILLPPGVFLRLADKSSFKMISNRLIDTRIELLTGSGIVEVDDLAKEATVTVVVKDATVSLNKGGLYRFDAAPAQIKVFKGEAAVAMGGENASVGAGKMLALSGVLASAQKFDVAETDSFDHWSRRRGELLANANISAAKQANGYSYGGANPCLGAGVGYGVGGPYGTGPFARPWGTWGYNPYYGLGTYIPCQGTLWSPYGYRFWSPYAVYQAFWAPRPTYTYNPGGGGFGGYNAPGAVGMSGGGYSGAMGSAASSGGFSGGSGAAAGGMGASSAAAGGGASGGHGGGGGGAAGGGGGHGK